MFSVGDLVKYAPQWCSEGERRFRFVVLEILNGWRLSYKIGCLNSSLALGFVETVAPEYIEKAEISECDEQTIEFLTKAIRR